MTKTKTKYTICLYAQSKDNAYDMFVCTVYVLAVVIVVFALLVVIALVGLPEIFVVCVALVALSWVMTLCVVVVSIDLCRIRIICNIRKQSYSLYES